MSKIYKVRLFDGKIVENNKDYELVGYIIVKKSNLGVEDLLTGYKLNVLKPGYLKVNSLNQRFIEQYGHQPFISQEDLVHKNLATPRDIDEYVEEFDESMWKKIYDEMKFFTLAEKAVISVRSRQLYKSRKYK